MLLVIALGIDRRENGSAGVCAMNDMIVPRFSRLQLSAAQPRLTPPPQDLQPAAREEDAGGNDDDGNPFELALWDEPATTVAETCVCPLGRRLIRARR